MARRRLTVRNDDTVRVPARRERAMLTDSPGPELAGAGASTEVSVMRAMVYSAPLTLEMQDVAEPSPRTGEVVVEVAAAGICGSELEGFATQSPFRVPPLVM